MNRREFAKAALATGLLPICRSISKQPAYDLLFDNYMPHFQLLTPEIAAGLSYSTGFCFAPRVVSDAAAVRFGKLLRRYLLTIQRDAVRLFGGPPLPGDQTALAWLAGEGSACRILWLEAFVRIGAFRVEGCGSLLHLTAER